MKRESINAVAQATEPGVFIDGAWRQGAGAPLELVDPCSAQPYARVSSASAEDVDEAVAAAERALRGWRSTSVAQRGERLERIAQGIEAHAGELVELQMRCNGKPRFEAELDVSDAAGTFRYYAQLCNEGHVVERAPVALPDAAFEADVRHEAVGVCALIVPWNFPLVTAAWKLAPALTAGCSVVIKPSELTPLAERALVDIVTAADVPAGVVNLVTGGREVGAQLASHRGVAKVSFTGSTAAGQAVMRAAAARMQRVSLELGGKSALIVFDDADLDEAVELAFNGAFFNAGQMCSATSRVLVARALHDAFIDKLVALARNAVVGAPHTADVRVGPLVSAAQRERVLGLLARGKEQGARVLCGGAATQDAGFFVAPTVCTSVAPDNVLWCEEIFGPVALVRAFDTEYEAIALANDSDYGLVATVVTADAARAARVSDACEAGTVWVNAPQVIFPQTGWGGRKLSGLGRELGPWGVRAYQEIKHVIRARTSATHSPQS
ncbi:betaine-aldehyde dehydrogenase [Paraburkholderia eburnea]|uniref:aldehyde dehydrogenase (NAD(+)) n=1 Tax=Paraburkholderia eburnea TaxID=1189126 RepID=A0A2S4ME63_9BURK|nr:aldehyde dehydrogenase family protein [Paraburkholderia eburnea]POR52717.1 betaine-aldehyde dehydrogenase [Paraburkholderia eburnea]PRZ23585.1 betaine-aldehyde dehydrogenase [Paraburkholderia eburnea]